MESKLRCDVATLSRNLVYKNFKVLLRINQSIKKFKLKVFNIMEKGQQYM